MSKYTRKNILHTINKNVKLSKYAFLMLILTSIILVPISFASPHLFGILIDDVLKNRHFELFKIVAAGLLTVFVLRLIFDGLNLYYSNKILNKFTYNLRSKMWKKYLKMDYDKYLNHNVGDLKMRFFDDINSIGNFHKEQIADYILNILMVFVAIVLTVLINYKLMLICLGAVPLVIVINRLIGKGFRHVNEETRKATEDYYLFEHDSLQFWKEIKSLNAQDSFIKRFQYHRMLLANLGYKWIKYWFYQEIFNDFKSNYLTKIFVYIAGAFFVINREITVGQLIVFSEYFGLLFSNIDELNSKNVALKINRPYFERVMGVLKDEVGEKSKVPDVKYKRCELTGDIAITEVGFKYNEESKSVLQGITLKLRRGDYLAITGASGAGKTTLIKLILGLHKCSEGNIEFGINDLSCGDNVLKITRAKSEHISDKIFYGSVGIVMQDGYLFNMSIRNNLLLANRHATQEELEDVCKSSNILDFIQNLPDGFETIIGEHGIKLSGGQKQRICIAQALLKNPSIIVLDEATSSLDAMSEEIILKDIDKISKDITVIFITHKSKVANSANRILQL